MGIVRVVLLVLLIVPSGCHRWVPHEGDPVPPGTEVRVRVSDAGSEELRRRYGASDGTLEGPLATWDDRGVTLLAQTMMRRPGFPATVVTDTIEVASRHLIGVDVQEIDGTRTALLAGGILAGGAALVFATRAFGGSSEPNEGGTPPPEALMIFRIPLGLGFGGR